VNPLKLVKDEWRYLIAGFMTSLVIALSSALLPNWVVKPIYEQILERGRYDQFLPLLLRAGAIIFVASLALYGQEVLFGIGGERLGARLRREVYAVLLRAGVGLAPDRQASESGPTSGGRAARVMSDVSALVNFFIYELGMFVTQGATVVTGFVFLLVQNPLLTCGLLIALVPLAWLLDRIGRGIENAFKANQKAVEGASGAMSEGLSRMEAIKAFRLERVVLERFRGPNEAQARASIRRVQLAALHWPLSQIVTGLGVVVLLMYTINEVQAKRLTNGAMIAYFTQLMTIIAPVQIFARLWARWTAMYEPARSIKAALELPAEADPGSLSPQTWRGELRFEAMTARYSGANVPALDDVNLTIRAGESVALVGPSGSGKTTITRLLLRLLDLESGRILLDGQNLSEYTLDSSRAAIALVPQQPQLFTGSILENVRLARPDANEAQVWRALEAANLAEEIRAMPRGLETMLGEAGSGISGGQAQRLSIARALLLEAPIIVLDEPTSALDAHSEAAVKRTLELVRGTRTVIVIAHRLTTVESVDRIVVLEMGRIIEEGSHLELIGAGGAYAGLLEANTK
jgi:ABC-type multidrug transport system fused ATPase/permease subunit